jgi:hypothetical protein
MADVTLGQAKAEVDRLATARAALEKKHLAEDAAMADQQAKAMEQMKDSQKRARAAMRALHGEQLGELTKDLNAATRKLSTLTRHDAMDRARQAGKETDEANAPPT